AADEVAVGGAPVGLDRLGEQLLLVAEGGVEAAGADAPGGGEVAEGDRLVAALPEQADRGGQGGVAVEGAGAAARGGGLGHVPDCRGIAQETVLPSFLNDPSSNSGGADPAMPKPLDGKKDRKSTRLNSSHV